MLEEEIREMIIESERTFLEEVRMSHLENIHHLHSFKEVDEFNTMGIPETIDETRKFIQGIIKDQKVIPQKNYAWAIISKKERQFIGLCGFSLSLNKFKLGEIYYKILPAFWGKGLATEVARLLIKTGFEEFNLHKVEAGVATENIASIKVLEKAGMVREGRRRKILPIRGEWKDNFHYAIVEDDSRDY